VYSSHVTDMNVCDENRLLPREYSHASSLTAFIARKESPFV
jgi:hypothetical protein